jgi:nicotinamidase/pyrazinamidase
MKALIVVDMQNDFITGSLAVKGAQEIVGPIQDRLREAGEAREVVAFTADAHPADHKSFAEQGGPWPAHCVQETRGFELQPGINAMAQLLGWPCFDKGRDAAREEYSGFDNPDLHRYLRSRHVTEIEVCGLARDFCVEATAEAARQLGYRVTVLEHLCRSVLPSVQ